MSERAPAFGDLGDFTPRKPAPRTDPKILDEVASDNGFLSRSPAKPIEETRATAAPTRIAKRYRTGRNQQLNVKVTAETRDLLDSIADELNQPLGAVLDLALKALVREQGGGDRLNTGRNQGASPCPPNGSRRTGGPVRGLDL